MAATVIHQFQCNACKGIYFDRSADGSTYHHACPDLPADKKGNVPVREDARDENVAVDANRAAIGIKAEGAGVTCLTSENISEPAWITKMYQRCADLEAEQAGGEARRG